MKGLLNLVLFFLSFNIVFSQTRDEQNKYKEHPHEETENPKSSDSSALDSTSKEIPSLTKNPKNSKNSIDDKLFVGGGLGLSFGTITSVSIAPVVGYELTEWLQVGIRGEYRYFKDNYLASLGFSNAEFSMVSTGVFARAILFDWVSLYAEYSHHWFQGYDYLDPNFSQSTQQKSWIDVPTLFIGGGLYQKIGVVGMGFEILYDVIQDEKLQYLYPSNRFPTLFRTTFTVCL